MCRCDDLIAGLYTKSSQSEINCVRAISARDATFYAKRTRPFVLKRIHVPPANVGRLGDDGSNRGVDFLFNRQILRVQINKGDFHSEKLEVREQKSGSAERTRADEEGARDCLRKCPRR